MDRGIMTGMRIRLGFSPVPDGGVMFYALAAGYFVGLESGFASEMGPGLALPLMEVLASERTAAEKIKALDEIEALRPVGKEERETVGRFAQSAELAAKVRRLRKRD